MPDIKLSAGINFGRPATEFIMEAKEDGEVTSCRNVITGTEYVGGGGSSDFSTAEVTIVGAARLRFPIIYEEGGFMPFGAIWVGETDSGDTITVPLFKNHLCIDTINEPTSISGSATYNSEYEWIDITGNCTLTFPDDI